MKTSRYLLEVTEIGLERMTTYVSSSFKRMQIGDFVFPEDKVPPRVKNQESYKKLIGLFNKLSDAIKDALNQIEGQQQKLKSELQKKEIDTESKVNKHEQVLLEVNVKENHNEEEDRINQVLPEEEAHRNDQILQQEKTKRKEEPELLKEGSDRLEEDQRAEKTEIDQAPEITMNGKLEEETALKTQRLTENSNEEQQEALKAKRLLQERTKELHSLPEVSEKEQKYLKEKPENAAAGETGKTLKDDMQKSMEVEKKEEKLWEVSLQAQQDSSDLFNAEALCIMSEKVERKEENQKREKIAEEFGNNRTHFLENSRSHRTKTWLVEHTLNEDKSCALREKMTQLYDATCKDLEADIFKLLDKLKYNEIKKHEIFTENVGSKMKKINQFLSEANEAVDAEYKELVSVLEEERARLQKVLNSSAPHEDPYVQSTLRKIEDIIKGIKELENEVNEFKSTKTDVKFLDLEQKLMNNVMLVDVIQTLGQDMIRKKKREAIDYATKCMEKLEANVLKDV